MSSKTRKVVGVRVADWTGYIHGIYQGIIDFSQTVGGWQIRTPIASDFELEPVTIDSDWEGDGLILFRYTSEEAEAFRKRKIPVVNLSREGDQSWIPYVGPDNQDVSTLAAEHLLGLGVRRFIYWGDPARAYSRERGQAFEKRIIQAGHSVQHLGARFSDMASRSDKWKRIKNLMTHCAKDLEPPVGLFAKDDLAASLWVEVCEEVGLRVPQDVAILGFGGDPVLGCITNPPLSSILHPVRQIGFETAQLLWRMMTEPGFKPLDVRVPVRSILQRESTDVFAFENQVLKKAVRLIKQEAPNRPVTVGELSHVTGVSRMTLLAAFKQHFKCSPKKFILDVRLTELKRCLLEPSYTFKEIAYGMKFSSPEDMSRFFQKHGGCSPTEFRKKHVRPIALPF